MAGLLLAAAGVDPYSYRAVVHQFHLHIGTENPGSYFLAYRFRKRLLQSFIKGHGYLLPGRTDIRRAVALPGRCVQRELAYDKYIAACLHNVEVHHPVRVVEYAQLGNFLDKPIYIFLSVRVIYPYENQQSGPYAGETTPVYIYGRACDPLYQ